MKSAIAALLLSLLFLNGCSYVSAGNEELLAAPTLNARQAKVRAALESTLNTAAIRYEYPLSGDYRSPFVFFEMDSGGAQGAIVFYSYTDSRADAAPRAKVLREDAGGEWATAYDIAGAGEQVDFISFSNLLDRDSKCIVIGWQSPRRSTLGVYSLGQTIREELSQPYAAYMVEDFDGSGLSEIVTASMDDATGEFALTLFGKGAGGHIEELDALPLARRTTEVLQLLCGRLWNGGQALYIDELLDGRTIVTEVLHVAARGFTPLAGEQGGEDITHTARIYETLLSTDLDGDGVVEIPIVRPMPGQEENGGFVDVVLAQYLHLTADGFTAVDWAVTNEEDGYRFHFPEKWLDTVRVESIPETREWLFGAADPEDDDNEIILLRIRVYTLGDYKDKFTNYTLMEQNGQLQYYIDVPRLPGEPLALTEQQVRALFTLL